MKLSPQIIITINEISNYHTATPRDIVVWRKEANRKLKLYKTRIPLNQTAEYFWYNKSLYKRILKNNNFNEQHFFYLDTGYFGEDEEIRSMRHNKENPIHVICQCMNFEFRLRMDCGRIFAHCIECDTEERISV